MKIPPLNLAKEYREIKSGVNRSLQNIFKSGQYILGREVQDFEKNFAKKIGAKFAAGVASGSDALYLSLMVLGIGAGDEVITTPHTYIATGTAIARLGAKPVFVDIDPETFNINPDLIEKKITRKTKVIMPVHLYGMPCDMTKIMAIARKYKLHVIEDCAQATGAKWRGKTIGSFGTLSGFSFYPTKILGAYGDGGMVVTNSAKLDSEVRLLRVQSDLTKKYVHHKIGVNSRLDTVQAAILDVKLKKMDFWNQKRIRASKIYDSLLKKSGLKEIRIPKRFSNVKHVYHQYTIWAKQRDALLKFLKSNGIAAGIYYPLPLHLQPCFKYLKYKKGSCPEAENAARSIISLPLFPQIQFVEQKFVVSKINEFYF